MGKIVILQPLLSHSNLIIHDKEFTLMTALCTEVGSGSHLLTILTH